MGEKTPRRRQRDGRLSLLPILTGRKVGPSRFPCGWQQVANRSWLASRSIERLTPVQNSTILRYPILHARGGAKIRGQRASATTLANCVRDFEGMAEPLRTM